MTVMDEYHDIREMLKPRRTIVATSELRERIGQAATMDKRRNATGKWLWHAAAGVAIILGATLLVKHHDTSLNNECIVYADGKQMSDDAARNIAEADIARMEQFMQTVARQRADEEAKVNQFMQHKTLSQ